MSIPRRLERLEHLARPKPAPEPLSPERFEGLMLRLQALGLAEWREDWQQWHPTDPQLLRRLLRERAAMRAPAVSALPHGERVTPW